MAKYQTERNKSSWDVWKDKELVLLQVKSEKSKTVFAASQVFARLWFDGSWHFPALFLEWSAEGFR